MLRVPLGIPGRTLPAHDGAPWTQQHTAHRENEGCDDWPLDAAWTPKAEAPAKDRVTAWFHPHDAQTHIGEARVAVASGACVTIYTQELSATLSRPSRPTHRRNVDALSQALGHSPPTSPLRMLGSHASSESTPSWRDGRWDAAQMAIVGTTHTRVSHGAGAADSVLDAEDLLEKQYRSHADTPVIAHPEGTNLAPHAHVSPRHSPRVHHAPPMMRETGTYTDTHLDIGTPAAEPQYEMQGDPHAIRRLVTPCGSLVVCVLVVGGTDELPVPVRARGALLLSLQSSGRLTAWNLDTLAYVASTNVHVAEAHVAGMPAGDFSMHPVGVPPGQRPHVLVGRGSRLHLVQCDATALHTRQTLEVPGCTAAGVLAPDGLLLTVYAAHGNALERLVFALTSDCSTIKPLSSENILIDSLAQLADCEPSPLVCLHAVSGAAVVGLSGAVLALYADGKSTAMQLPSTLVALRTISTHRVLCICDEHLAVLDTSGHINVEHADVLEERRDAALTAFIRPDGQIGVVDGTPAAYGHLKPTAILPLTMTRIVLAIERGLVTTDMPQVLTDADLSPVPGSKPTWEAEVTILQHLANPRTGTRHILGGSDHGDICVWDAATLRLEAEWSGFSAPLQHVVPLVGLPHTSRLHGCVLCVASDGTSGLLLLDDLKLVQLFPGADAPLVRVAARTNELLLQYGSSARVWNVETLELVRHVSGDALHALFSGDDWHVFAVPESPRGAPLNGGAPAGMLLLSGAASQAVSVLVADMRRCLDTTMKLARGALGTLGVSAAIDAAIDTVEACDVTAPQRIARDDPAAAKISGPVSVLQRIFLPPMTGGTFGDLMNGGSLVALAADGNSGYLSVTTEEHGWRSATANTVAEWLLAATSLTLLMSMIDGLHDESITALRQLLDPSVRECGAPSLARLAKHVVDENEVLRMAARILFRQYCVAAEPSSLVRLADTWTEQLLRGTDAGVFLVLGLVAAERYAYMSPARLKQVSHAIAQNVSPRAPTEWAVAALELCSIGFDVWQHYVDAVALVRGIFELATDEQAAGILRTAARRATLALASQHGALFMSTLAMDILHAPSAHHNQVALRLVAFMVRHKPLALYPSLPRLAEAVVKSLDPTSTRANMVQAATVMINELVQTYPSIAFHRQSQRLAVGTAEGSVVMYDLKTGTRYCVLSGHAKPVTACSFSPDGRRFLSMSLAEERVLIWHMGTGLLDIIPSAMARVSGTQSDTGATKTIKFHLGVSDCPSGAAFVLSGVSFEWPNNRSVRMHIGEASVNIGV